MSSFGDTVMQDMYSLVMSPFHLTVYLDGVDGWKKDLSTKWGFCYHGNGNNVTLPWLKFNDVTTSSIGGAFNQLDISSVKKICMGKIRLLFG